MEKNLNTLLGSIKGKVEETRKKRYENPENIISNFYCEAGMNSHSFADFLAKRLVSEYLKIRERELQGKEAPNYIKIDFENVTTLYNFIEGYNELKGKMDDKTGVAINLILDYFEDESILGENFKMPKLIENEMIYNFDDKRLVLATNSDGIIKPVEAYTDLFDDEGFHFTFEGNTMTIKADYYDLQLFVTDLINYQINRDLWSMLNIDEKYIDEIKNKINEIASKEKALSEFKAISDKNIQLIILNIFKVFTKKYQDRPLYLELTHELPCYVKDKMKELISKEDLEKLNIYESQFEEDFTMPIVIAIPYTTKGTTKYLPVISTDFKKALGEYKVNFAANTSKEICSVSMDLDDFELLVLSTKEESSKKGK